MLLQEHIYDCTTHCLLFFTCVISHFIFSIPVQICMLDSQSTVRLAMAVWLLTGLLTVQLYWPASFLFTGLIIRDPGLMRKRGSDGRLAFPLPHVTLAVVPEVQLQVKDTLPPSIATEGTDRLTPPTATEEENQERS